MKSIFFTILFTSFLFAANPYLTPQEAKAIASHIDDMCPDTYCGGDMQFFIENMTCTENECVMQFNANGVSTFNDPKEMGLFNNSIRANTNEDISIFFGQYALRAHEDNRYQEMKISFQCIFKNLPSNRSLFSDNYDMFWSMTLDCIQEFEERIYDWN
jgi:hypothetical protein